MRCEHRDLCRKPAPPFKIQDCEPIEKLGAYGRYDEQVDGCNTRGMIAEEGFPAQ